MLLGTNRKIKDNVLSVFLNGELINYTTTYKYLGVLVDQTVNLNEHFGQAFKRASSRLRLLKKTRPFLTIDAAETIYKSMTVPLLTNSRIITLNLNHTESLKVANLQEQAEKIIKSSDMVQLQLPEVMSFVKRQKCILVNCTDKNLCSNFDDYFNILQHEKNTRNNGISFKLRKVRLEATKNAFFYSGAI